MGRYADILLPVAVPQPFTYAVPAAWGGDAVRRGMWVRVPLGKRKVCVGLVWQVHDHVPRSAPKELIEVLGPGATPEQLRLWEWMAGYYMCTPGEVMKAAVPGEVRLGEFRPARELHVRLTTLYTKGEQITQFLEQNKRAQAQSRALLTYLSLIPTDAQGEPAVGSADREQLWVVRAAMTETVPASAILKLVERGVLEQQELIPLDAGNNPRPEYPIAQRDALEGITQPVVLVQGGTQEQLAELYADQAARAARMGKQALILLPDTVGRAATVHALCATFAARCVVYHSRLSDHARSRIYHRLITDPGSVDVVVGTRAALFLPYDRLGLIAVEDEQNGNYRQGDPAPRYQGRDVAVMLGQLHGAKTLLSSPTPSLESWSNAQSGKYGSLPLDIHPSTPPKVTVLERGKGLISKYLHRRIEQTLEAGRQVVLFQNRRGFAPYIQCEHCGYTPQCPHCNVTPTYHKEAGTLQCHYCGWMVRYTSVCPACGLQTMALSGIGTERIEEEAAERFPQTRVARIDADVAGSEKGAIGRVITDFVAGQTGILVGTQLVARTAQMGDIGLVGVINGDALLAYPDFRSGERAFQLLMQLGGLLSQPGELVVQSAQRGHRVLSAVERGDTAGFYGGELLERREMHYPPFARMVRLTLRHRERSVAVAAATQGYLLLQEPFGSQITPPFEPQVDRVQNLFIQHLLIRLPRTHALAEAKALISAAVAAVRKQYSTIHLVIEVDPQ